MRIHLIVILCGLSLVPARLAAQASLSMPSSGSEQLPADARTVSDSALAADADVLLPPSPPAWDAFGAQAASGPPPTPEHTGLHALFHNVIEDVTKLPAMPNLYIAAAGGGLALAVHPADATFNAKLAGRWNTFFAPGKYLGNSWEQVGATLVTYGYGRLADKPKVAHLANDLLQAQILSELLFEPIKLATHRLRPYQTTSCGLNCSFPSGHATVTFADATVIERHLGWRYSIIGYAIATYVATSRLHDNQHWLSDVVFGAATGTIAGRTVVHHARDYWALTPAPVPGGGVALLVTRSHQTD